MARIDAFELPPEDDEAFLAELQRRGDGDATPGRRTLLRALREDATLRWVAVTRVDAPEPATGRAREPAPAAGPRASAAHAGAYEVVHDEGAVDGEGGVVLIVAFQVPEADDERFREGWEAARAQDALQRGRLGGRLYRSLGPAHLRWVQMDRWSSPLMVHRARRQPEVRRAAPALALPSHTALYQVVGR